MWGAALRTSGLRSLAVRCAQLRAAPLPRALGAQDLVAKRWMCSKPEESKPKESGASFKVPGHSPTNLERKILVWGGRFKKEEDIPELVSYEMVDTAKSRVRVKVSYLMIGMTIIGCITMVISGKRAVGRHESLAGINLEKKSRLKEESQKEELAKAK
ncbi:protein FAM162A [Discoglossus pictus]